MPEYLSPGVYVEEIDTGPVPIEGVSTSTAGFVGMTLQAPPTNNGLPVLVTSFGEFQRVFGGYISSTPNDKQCLPYAVQGFFENGGQRLYIARVVSSASKGSASKSANLQSGLVTRLNRGKDVSAGATSAQLSTLRGIQASPPPTPPTGAGGTPPAGAGGTPPAGAGGTPPAGAGGTPPAGAGGTPPAATGGTTTTSTPTPRSSLKFTQIKDGITTTRTVTVRKYEDSTGTITFDPPGEEDKNKSFEARYTHVSIENVDPDFISTPTPVVIQAINEGTWGNNLTIQVFPTSLTRAQVQRMDPAKLDTVILNSAANFYKGAIVEFNKGNTRLYGKVKDVVGKTIILKKALPDAKALDVDTGVDKTKFPATIASTCEFRLAVSSNGAVEDYPILTLDEGTPYYFGKLINGISKFITVSGNDNTSEHPFTMPSADDGLNVNMENGVGGGDPSYDDFIGTDNGPGQRTGIKALEDIEQISIIAAPGIAGPEPGPQSVVNALIEQCTRLKYRFAILDPYYTQATALDDIQSYRQLYDTHYAAIYFPKVVISDPNPASPSGSTIVIPPSGHIAGIYARTDDERGVHKAPANEVILGITDLDLNVTKGEQDILNPLPNNINVLRNFRHQGRGLRVWGARCITGDTQWKYVNVRRLFIFIEASLDQGTQWVVFEPNAEPLWARVTQSISNFLTSVWRDGALMGTKPEEAFFVRVGYSTMTQDDIDNGRLIILVGIAPVKPAEFVIIRISQYTATASTTGQ